MEFQHVSTIAIAASRCCMRSQAISSGIVSSGIQLHILFSSMPRELESLDPSFRSLTLAFVPKDGTLGYLGHCQKVNVSYALVCLGFPKFHPFPTHSNKVEEK